MEFDDYRDADDACYEMNGRDLLGERVSVEIARGTPHGRDREKWGGGSGRDRRDDRRGRGEKNWTFTKHFNYVFMIW